MALSWINFNNGDVGLDIRNSLNAFNTATVVDVNANTLDIVALYNSVAVNLGKINTNITNIGTNTSDIAANVLAIAQNSADIGVNVIDIAALDVRVAENTGFITSPKPSVNFEPQVTTPTHLEGRLYYDAPTGSFKAQGPITGLEVAIGHDMHVHVVNNTGAIIEKGMACRQNGIALGKIQVTKAIATSFEEARVFGIAQGDIANGAEGALVTFGEIINVDTNGQPIGVPLYLSDTVAGTYGPISPDIVTRIGGALTADAISGRLFTSIINNKILPTVLGGLKGSTPGNETYLATAIAKDIRDYLITSTVVTTVDPLLGTITLPNDGEYRANFTASISFPSLASTRSVHFELYDATSGLVGFTFVKNIPRDATEDSLSFSVPFSENLGNIYKMRIKSAIDISVTFADVSFDIESVSIR